MAIAAPVCTELIPLWIRPGFFTPFSCKFSLESRYRAPFAMEIFLNLCWLFLVLPALLTWRRQERSSRERGHASLLRLGALGCALVLLFPVISASDDLHAMRQEMEESSSKLKAGASAKGSPTAIFHLAAAIPARTTFVSPGEGVPGAVRAYGSLPSLLRPLGASHGRAPPPPIDF